MKIREMISKKFWGLLGLSMLMVLTLPLLSQAQDVKAQSKANTPTAEAKPVQETKLSQEVRHDLVMLPFYTLFDNLEYQIEGSTVILSGEVVRPTLKSDAAGVVKHIEGVTKVVNDIKVLRLSPYDNELRVRAFHAIYSMPGFDLYAIQAVPPIHIIVDQGNITLVGVVRTQADKDMAGIAANSVSGAFKVTNDLRVEKNA